MTLNHKDFQSGCWGTGTVPDNKWVLRIAPSHPLRWAFAALGCFSHACTAEYSRRIFCKPLGFSLSSPTDYIVNSSPLGFPELPVSSSQLGDPTGHSLGSPPWTSAWGLSWGSKAGQPWGSHPLFHVSQGTLPFVASRPESWELILSCFDLILTWSYLVYVFRFFFSSCSGKKEGKHSPFYSILEG